MDISYGFSAFSCQSFSSSKEAQITNLAPLGQNFIAFTGGSALRALLSSSAVPRRLLVPHCKSPVSPASGEGVERHKTRGVCHIHTAERCRGIRFQQGWSVVFSRGEWR